MPRPRPVAPDMVDPAKEISNATITQLNDLTVVAGQEELLRANHLDTLDALFTYTGGESLAKPGLSSWRQRTRLTVEGSQKPRTLYLKRFRNPPMAARREVRKSGTGALSVAGVEWTWIHRLTHDEVPCVKPVAFGEELRGGRERRSAILTEAVPGNSLETWMGRWGADDRDTVCGLIAPSARLVARLHTCGYVHRDLYLSHVFYNPALPYEESLCLIDLQRVVHPEWPRRRWIVKELASLNFSTPSSLVSRTDRLRWLKHYADVSKLDGSTKSLAYRVIGKTARIARHDRRRRERLANAGATRG